MMNCCCCGSTDMRHDAPDREHMNPGLSSYCLDCAISRCDAFPGQHG